MNNLWLQQLPLPDVQSAVPVGGGDVNKAFHVKTSTDDYFLLVQPQQPASFYAGEIAGLKAFEEAGVRAPRVILNGQINGAGYLLLNYLDSQPAGDQAQLGRLVAQLHQYKSPTMQYGFSTPYAGTSVSFSNQWTDSWEDLFVHQRLDVLAAHILKKGLWGRDEKQHFDQARGKILEALSQHKSTPVLLHGDLWSGNYMFLKGGQPVLIDPAAVYGDREFDIAITSVFGGFSAEFYQAYQEALPLESGAEKRMNYYRLYYLMVHLDKFGMTYASAVHDLLNQIMFS